MVLRIQTFQENKSVITVAVRLYPLLTYFMQKILTFSSCSDVNIVGMWDFILTSSVMLLEYSEANRLTKFYTQLHFQPRRGHNVSTGK
jgi:hypothetical protein